MAKTYEVKVDVTISGSFYIEAESEELADIAGVKELF